MKQPIFHGSSLRDPRFFFFSTGKAHIFHFGDEVSAYTASKRKKSLTDGNGEKTTSTRLGFYVYLYMGISKK